MDPWVLIEGLVYVYITVIVCGVLSLITDDYYLDKNLLASLEGLIEKAKNCQTANIK